MNQSPGESWFFQEALQRVCAAFLACWKAFAASYPNEFVKKEEDNIRKALLGHDVMVDSSVTVVLTSVLPDPRFMLRHADNDLFNLLSESVPPIDLKKIGIFRGPCSKFEKEVGAALSNNFSLVVLCAAVFVFRLSEKAAESKAAAAEKCSGCN